MDKLLTAVIVLFVLASYVLLVSADNALTSASGSHQDFYLSKSGDISLGPASSGSLSSSKPTDDRDGRVVENTKEASPGSTYEMRKCGVNRECSKGETTTQSTQTTNNIILNQSNQTKETICNPIDPMCQKIDGCNLKAPECADSPVSGCNVREKNFVFDANYQFDGGIYVCSDNRIVDCRSRELIGAGEGFGISVIGYNKVTIKACKIENYKVGIRMIKSEGSTVRVNMLAGNEIGLLLIGSDGNSIRYNKLYNNGIGASMSRSKDNELLYNKFDGNRKDLSLTKAGGNEFSYNSIKNIK